MNVVILTTSPHGQTAYIEEMPFELPMSLTRDLSRAEVMPDFVAEEMIQALYAMARHDPDFVSAGFTFATAELILSLGPRVDIADVGVNIETDYKIHNIQRGV